MFFNKPILNKYGWKPDLPDNRDHLFCKLNQEASVNYLPTSVDLRPYCSSVENQGSLGSCTSFAIAGALEFLDIKNKMTNPHKFSHLFIYYNERAIEGTIKQDSGAQIRDGIKSLVQSGCCIESIWPYNISRFTQKPNANAYKQALPHKLLTYQRIVTLNDMKTCLAAGFPFVFGFSVYSSFESQQVANTGIVPMPKTNEQLLGGHAVCAVGYNDKDKTILVKNSWGTSWGQKGYFTLPYDYISNNNLADDMWTLRKTISE
jgi:C1A family cysteine protease